MFLRKTASLTALVSFVLLIVTSVVLYVVPDGRVAYWTNWRLWGLSKEQWGAVHINLGVLLLIAILLHLWYNWQAVVGYLKNKVRELRIFTLEFNLALVLTLFVFFGTLAGIPPLSSIIDLGNTLTEKANLRYGEPPYGHAELSPLEVFAARVELDLQESLLRLREAGIGVRGPQQTLEELAAANQVPPQRLYQIMQPPGGTGMPPNPPAGTGNRTLAQLCELYKLDSEEIVAGLQQQGIAAQPRQTIREIARANNLDPQGVYAAIYEFGADRQRAA